MFHTLLLPHACILMFSSTDKKKTQQSKPVKFSFASLLHGVCSHVLLQSLSQCKSTTALERGAGMAALSVAGEDKEKIKKIKKKLNNQNQ